MAPMSEGGQAGSGDRSGAERRASGKPASNAGAPAGGPEEPEEADFAGALDFEGKPLTRPEYISALVHLYRGELYRATSWRMRLDNTTNWAVLTTAGLLSLSFGSRDPQSHFVLLIGMALVTVFWIFESRRYRFADIWYSRLRMVEENFYGPILRRDLDSPHTSWGLLVAEDLFRPAFKITRKEALRARFLRNYWAIYGVIGLAWSVRIFMGPHGVDDIKHKLTLGALPWWSPLVVIAAFLLFLLVLLTMTTATHSERENDHWKITP